LGPVDGAATRVMPNTHPRVNSGSSGGSIGKSRIVLGGAPELLRNAVLVGLLVFLDMKKPSTWRADACRFVALASHIRFRGATLPGMGRLARASALLLMQINLSKA
jgi:hypothetical protein